MKHYLSIAVAVTLTIGTLQVKGQALGVSTNLSFGFNPDQAASIRVTEKLDEMKVLTQRLEEARKEAVKAALDASAPDAVRAKVEAVTKIQVEIAMLRYERGVKPVLSTVNDIQKSQLLKYPGGSYNQIFVGKTSGLEFTRGGRFEPGPK
jgi:hypothetical protein